MPSLNSASFLLYLILLVSVSSNLVLGHKTSSERGRRDGGGRRVLGFKETPLGGNVTFECSPSGPCIACRFSEKNDEKYRCSETGYRIPLKCVETGAASKEANKKRTQKNRAVLENNSAREKQHVTVHNAEESSTPIRQRSLLSGSTTSGGGSQAYITYRSCIPAVNEEKLSVLGFEGIMLGLLLMSSSVVYFRRKQNSATSGVGAMRIPTNSRF